MPSPSSNGLAETEMCLPYTIEQLHESDQRTSNISNAKLASAQQAP
ncbi:MAG: hypothetical protein M0C28_41350 [Candidatus Moduliflexus flocculans]|nr:hypothetical protein [Candidatus Moduliflexus flocculans]